MPRDLDEILTTPDSTVSYDDSAAFDWNAAYVAPGRPYNPLRVVQTGNYDPGPFRPPPEIFPTVRIIDPDAEDEDDPEDFGDAAVPVSVAIPPSYRPPATVFEDFPGGIYETNRAPTDWDRVYDEYVVLNAPYDLPTTEELEVPIDWGEFVGSVVGGLWDPFGIANPTAAAINSLTGGVTGLPSLGQQVGPTAGANVMPANGCPPVGPKYAKICLATGAVTPLRRRRRRRLLTSSDIKDLSALKSIVGGAALQGAVVQAVRR